MSPKRQRESGTPPEGLLATANTWGRRVILTAVLVFFGALWVAAAGYNVNELRKGVLAASGHYGEAGMVTVNGYSGSGKKYCSGSFSSFSGSTAVAVRVEMSGRCPSDAHEAARLVRGNKNGMFVGDEMDVAWTPGAMGWFQRLLLSLLFGGPLLLILYGIAHHSLRGLRRGPSRGDGKATPA